ncbi:hypothetical protein I41_08360 [Lacipirellula limnantheis]|uniref:Uncharacterized protein n=1 Tax=Lacipirellula limnantheis TaxID=2528024 RepID=A0A517TTI4_9BACT|nr:hypothetical protein I41_08360 [Lacipirellula limnantheis]
MEKHLPFPVSARPWESLSEPERDFFCFQDNYLPLHRNHASKIGLLSSADAARVCEWAFATVPLGWPDTGRWFQHEEQLNIQDCWNDERRRADVRQWLSDRHVPFATTVYLLYERDRVVETNWQMVVRYWDAFAWSVGFAMVTVDDTLQWACGFHHEEVIVLGQQRPPHNPPMHRTGPAV